MMYKTDTYDAKLHIAERRGLCPVCGRNMVQADRVKEGNHIFIWYKCADGRCSGQRLQRQTSSK